jgi:hypothetical protein
LNPLQLNLGGR